MVIFGLVCLQILEKPRNGTLFDFDWFCKNLAQVDTMKDFLSWYLMPASLYLQEMRVSELLHKPKDPFVPGRICGNRQNFWTARDLKPNIFIQMSHSRIFHYQCLLRMPWNRFNNDACNSFFFKHPMESSHYPPPTVYFRINMDQPTIQRSQNNLRVLLENRPGPKGNDCIPTINFQGIC